MHKPIADHVITEVCQGPECREWGGPELLEQLSRLGYTTAAGHCQGLCHFAPIAHVGRHCIAEASLDSVREKLEMTISKW